eukprot:g1911.t1
MFLTSRIDQKTGATIWDEKECAPGTYNPGGSSATQYIKQVNIDWTDKLVLDNKTCVSCKEAVGISCDGTSKRYEGGVWHDPNIINPDKSTRIYTCVTDGCPEDGELDMRCKPGFVSDAPICAVCMPGYIAQLRQCNPCEKPRFDLLIIALLAIVLMMYLVFRMVRKYGHQLRHSSVLAHVKILISFIMVAVTVDTQFGIGWPDSFIRALDALSLIAFDFGVFAGLFCLVRMDFYQSLLSSTLTLLTVVIAIHSVSKYVLAKGKSPHEAQAIMGNSRFVTAYILLFAFPVVSVDLVEAFACHEVCYDHDECTSYLRVDYSIQCHTSRFYFMSAYAGIWTLGYVIAFPMLVFWKLLSYNRKLRDRTKDVSQLNYGFLLEDYKHHMPCIVHEGIEMLRKLLLSIVGAFFADKSTMAVALATIISFLFFGYHVHFFPYKSVECNRLQTLCLGILNFIYFAGLLLKTQSVQESDK